MPPPKRGLVLGGGGARGAYQVGCFRAFRELGLDFPIVAGTSVGALNGALYCLDEIEKLEDLWLNIKTKDLLTVPEPGFSGVLKLARNAQDALDAVLRNLRSPKLAAFSVGRILFDAWRDFSRTNKEKLSGLLDAHLDPSKVKRARRELIITVTTLTGTDYKSTRRLTPRQIREDIQASASIPFIFDPIFSRSRRMIAWDGGANIFNLAANVPIQPIYDRGIRDIVVIWLTPILKDFHPDFPDARILNILPSKRLGNILRFNPSRARTLIKMGYEDAMKAVRRYAEARSNF